MELKERPEVLKGVTRKVRTSCGNVFITVNFNENNQAIEVFSRLGKAGACAASNTEALGRLITLALKNNIASEAIVRQLKGISCHSPCFINEQLTIKSCADAVGYALEEIQKVEPKDDK